ncbi:MAG: GNAT family N-acetyltransferase [Spirochaetes bacterium]|nr:GNAT family N-acetyltransferase [Spirochaetota bacterium]MBN2769462.1 GNAT family N-acetyltransferase [Spirochaetota bacterium]
MNKNIRLLTQPDLPYVYDICLRTGNNGDDAHHHFRDPFLIGQYYAAPYLFYEPDVCFAVIDGQSAIRRPSGYIVGTSDSTSYYKWLHTCWLPRLQQIYPSDLPKPSEAEKWILRLVNGTDDIPTNKILSDYPAHLHIDLLPCMQGKGYGKLLIQNFITALKEKSCPGVHLGVSKQNVNAIGFYKRSGFLILEEDSESCLLGIRLI